MYQNCWSTVWYISLHKYIAQVWSLMYLQVQWHNTNKNRDAKHSKKIKPTELSLKKMKSCVPTEYTKTA